ncbi:MAG: glycosyltransferase family 1 protein [Chloroflexota bacterium]
MARYQSSLQHALTRLGLDFTLVQPTIPGPIKVANRLLQRFNFDLLSFFTTYPLAANLKSSVPTHLTTQQMGFLLWHRRRLRPCLITVHDIVPYLVRRDANQSTFRHPLDTAFDEAAMRGLKLADCLIADSKFTKRTLVETLDYQEDRIQVVPLAIAHDVFRPRVVPGSFYARFSLDPSLRYILYVGSENPRKNLPRLLRAFSAVRARFPDVRLLKIGTAEYPRQAKSLQQQVAELGLALHVRFIPHVSDDDLVLLYNLASLFVFPSLLEGFGLPPLEAMACGTPVVCSNAASLPEVVGEAALTVDPYDVDALATAMYSVLEDVNLADQFRARGVERAKAFTWEKTARETIGVYERVFEWGQPNK